MINAIIFDFFGVLEQGEQPNEALLEYIRDKLKPKYKIGIISNSSGHWRGRLLSDQQMALFDFIGLSGELNIAKPDREIFELAAKNLKAQPHECVFIDDSEDHCRGARTAGMQAIYYENFDQLKQALEKLLPSK